MTNKLLVVLFAGPESACKLEHAVLFARDVVARGGEATVILEGAAPAWLPGFVDKSDKLTSFFAKAMEENLIAGVCKACAGAADEVRVTVAWELTWYQWGVDLGNEARPPFELGNGREVGEIDAAARQWNASTVEGGRIVMIAPR